MKSRIWTLLFGLALLLGFSGIVYASSGYLNNATTGFSATYPNASSSLKTCTVCHTSTGGSAPTNPYGKAYGNNGHSFAAIASLDSDGDGFSNVTEINAGYFPGDAASHPPTTTDTTAPQVTAFSIPAAATSLTVSISSLTATDNVGVAGYLVTESATAPSASAAGWTGTRPASYTFATAGSKTLYGWAKDAANNVSASRSASVTVTLPDTAAPQVTAFSIPAAATSLTVSITSLTATDNVGVTGYLVSESATAPAAGWTAGVPSSYTFTSAGAKTLYAWARDAVGNISASRSASVTITLPDSTAPQVTAFSIPAAATSLTVSISSLTATDNVGVTGYLVT